MHFLPSYLKSVSAITVGKALLACGMLSVRYTL
jgi:hypothetical protein